MARNPVVQESDMSLWRPLHETFMESLNDLVGLREVKTIVEQMFAYVVVQRLREKAHLQSDRIVGHMVFTGNPGTGKTTVARLLGRYFNDLGILSGGQVVEVERADLVGEYVGHTASRTRSVMQQARGGVLFIDEAYALGRGGERDFGREAIDTLVKGMEDAREDLMVILAGYEEEMGAFIALNPGLYSRFPIHIHFADLNERELIQVASKMVSERDYRLSPDALCALRQVIRRAKERRTFGNARTIRNIVDTAIRHHALRILDTVTPSREVLMTLSGDDIRDQ